MNKQAGLPTTIDSNKMFVTKLKETPIYSQSSITSDLIGTVDKGTQFAYEDREGDFYKVSVGNGKYGYIPYNAGVDESVTITLEYAYDDWCVA